MIKKSDLFVDKRPGRCYPEKKSPSGGPKGGEQVKISDGVKAAMTVAGMKQKDLMPLFNTTKQGVSTKIGRNSWYGKDLVRVAKAMGADLAFVFPNGTVIKIENDEQEGTDDQDA
jgi:hypothetical protein